VSVRRRRWAAALLAPGLAAAAAAGCGGGPRGACSNDDGALTQAAFVFVEAPRSGERVSSGFRVTGCSSTFEATLAWTLRARDGRVLARGSAQGGGLEPGAFAFPVRYTLAERQVGSLEVAAPRVTREGFPPPKEVVPLVLEP